MGWMLLRWIMLWPLVAHVESGSTGNFIKGNTISSNRDGIFLGENCDNNQVTNGNTISSVTSIGISLWRSGGQTISDNVINTALTGIRLLGSSDNTITGNALTGNGTGIIVDASWQAGIWYPSSNNTISGNNISGNTNGFVIADLVHQTTTVIAEETGGEPQTGLQALALARATPLGRALTTPPGV